MREGEGPGVREGEGPGVREGEGPGVVVLPCCSREPALDAMALRHSKVRSFFRIPDTRFSDNLSTELGRSTAGLARLATSPLSGLGGVQFSVNRVGTMLLISGLGTLLLYSRWEGADDVGMELRVEGLSS